MSVAPGLTVRIPRVETAETVASLKKPLPTRYAVGQRVRAFVLSADAARRRMIVTLRTPAGRAGALFTLFRPELGLWVGTFHIILQSKHALMTASMLHVINPTPGSDNPTAR